MSDLRTKEALVAELREKLQEYSQGLVVMDEITREDQYKLLENFDEWAKTAEPGDAYHYYGENYILGEHIKEEKEEEPGVEAKFSVMCNAVYNGSLIIPASVPKTREAYLEYIRDNLPNVPVTDLEWLEDIDPENAVTKDDVRDWGIDENEFEDEKEDIELD